MKKISHVGEIQIKYKPSVRATKKVKTPRDAFKALIKHYDLDTLHLQEQFFVLYLNRDNRVLGVYQVSKGGITSTVVDIRLIFSVALKLSATGILLSHNHPSGSCKPSKEDISITERVGLAAMLFDIKMLGHILVTGVDSFVAIKANDK